MAAGESTSHHGIPPADLERWRNEVVEWAHRSYARGLVPGVSGNLSMRIPGKDLILISATGTAFFQLRPEEVLLVDFEQRVLDGEGRPSREVRWHLGVYQARPEAGAILHVHPPAITAYAVAGFLPPMATTAARGILKRLGMVELAPSGSPELAQFMVDCVRSDPEIKVVVMKEHGIAAIGKDLREAYMLADYAEDTARVTIYARILAGGGG